MTITIDAGRSCGVRNSRTHSYDKFAAEAGVELVPAAETAVNAASK
jgi:hypothetical protein